MANDRQASTANVEERHGILGIARWVQRYLEDYAWSPAHVGARGPRGLWFRICRITWLAGRGFFRDQCLIRASALTYITVLALVPLLAFSFSVAKGFGFYQELLRDTINPFLDRTFGELTPQGPMVVEAGAHDVRVAIDRIFQFVDRTEVSALGFLGVALLFFTVVKLLASIESSFNDIWGAQRSRSILRKVSDYLAMIVITPIFLFTATGLTTAAETRSSIEYLRQGLGLGPVLDILLSMMPVFALWAGFTFVYLAMPNARTRLGSAIIGALIAAVLWQVSLIVQIRFQVGIARYDAIYSSFAALPLFLIWVNVSWIAVLLGAEVCFAHQSEPSYVRVDASRRSDHAFVEIVGLRAMARVALAFTGGEERPTAARLASQLGVPERALEEVLATLADAGILAEIGEGPARQYLPARDLESISVKSVLDALKGHAGPVLVPAQGRADELVDRALAGIDQDLSASRHNKSLRALVDQVRRDRAESEKPASAPAAHAADGLEPRAG